MCCGYDVDQGGQRAALQRSNYVQGYSPLCLWHIDVEGEIVPAQY